MPAMTPIKDIVYCGTTIATRDHADGIEVCAVAPDASKAEWIAWSMGLAHSVPVTKVDELPGQPTPATPAPAELMTAAEHRAMDLTANLVNLVVRDVIGHGPARHGDVNEFVAAIHVVQRMLLKQAAGRAYPDRYRLLGGWPPNRDEPGPVVPQDDFGSDTGRLQAVVDGSNRPWERVKP